MQDKVPPETAFVFPEKANVPQYRANAKQRLPIEGPQTPDKVLRDYNCFFWKKANAVEKTLSGWLVLVLKCICFFQKKEKQSLDALYEVKDPYFASVGLHLLFLKKPNAVSRVLPCIAQKTYQIFFCLA